MKALVRQVAAPVADLGDEHLVAVAGNQVRAVSPYVFKLKRDILNIWRGETTFLNFCSEPIVSICHLTGITSWKQ